MGKPTGLRDRKKLQTRQRIADAAAALFAQRGYDAVSMLEVARAADVSDQTVYNHFAAKQDLVLDLAEQIRGWYERAIRDRSAATSPADALWPFLEADIDRYRTTSLGEARGQFLAQSVASVTLRRFTLEERERQTRTIANAITASTPDLPDVVAHVHAGALVAAIQYLHDQIGTSVLDQAPQQQTAEHLHAIARAAWGELNHAFSTHHAP